MYKNVYSLISSLHSKQSAQKQQGSTPLEHPYTYSHQYHAILTPPPPSNPPLSPYNLLHADGQLAHQTVCSKLMLKHDKCVLNFPTFHLHCLEDFVWHYA